MEDPHTIQRRRRIVMQLAMWLALGATVGLAALVNQTIARPQQVEGDGLSVRLPQQWQLVRTSDPRVAIQAFDQETLREVALVRQRVGPGTGPAQYLQQSGLLSPDYRRDRSAAILDQRPIRMAGQTGLLVIGLRYVPQLNENRRELLAAVVLPTGEAVTIKLDGPAGPQTDLALVREDAVLIQQIADSLVVTPRPSR